MDEKHKGKFHKVLGAGIGWIMGGPVGAALGLLVGHTLHENAELLEKGTFGTGLREEYGVLQVPYDAGPEQIKAAYKRLAQKYHPDRFADTDPVIRELAKERMADINAAYAKIMGRVRDDTTQQ
ncbi:MAG: DnaJ domain-containing protein [Desulfobacterales bacterium]|nr:MAG: DnaJ domain-containing protein [Desulfobacterales bacterium]